MKQDISFPIASSESRRRNWTPKAMNLSSAKSEKNKGKEMKPGGNSSIPEEQ